VELEYEKKIAELNRKEESAITKKDVDLFHLNTEMENEIKVKVDIFYFLSFFYFDYLIYNYFIPHFCFE
jgi:hypothetical protein